MKNLIRVVICVVVFMSINLISRGLYAQGYEPNKCGGLLNSCVAFCPGKGSNPGTTSSNKAEREKFFKCQKKCYSQFDHCKGKKLSSTWKDLEKKKPIQKPIKPTKVIALPAQPEKIVTPLSNVLYRVSRLRKDGQPSTGFQSCQIVKNEKLNAVYRIKFRDVITGNDGEDCLTREGLSRNSFDCTAKGTYCRNRYISKGCIVNREWLSWYQKYRRAVGIQKDREFVCSNKSVNGY